MVNCDAIIDTSTVLNREQKDERSVATGDAMNTSTTLSTKAG
ncbi:MAG: hypothetical protein WDN26_20380 [Chitinophagaceae bacterium]